MRRLVLALALPALLAMSVVSGAPAGARVEPVPARDPVLLVHGFNGSGASWHTMKERLLGAGYPASSVDAMSYDSGISNVEDRERHVASDLLEKSLRGDRAQRIVPRRAHRRVRGHGLASSQSIGGRIL